VFPNLSSFITSLLIIDNEQMFLGSSDKVYIIDKVEGNPTTINGHPVWASVWSALFPFVFPIARFF